MIAPPGSFVNVSYPASCTGGNSDTHPTTVDVLLKAFSQFSERSSAADGGTCGCIGFGGEDPQTREPYAHLHLEGVGWGGRDDADGNDAQFVKNGNCANTPVEVAETRYPFLNIEYQLEPGKVRPRAAPRRLRHAPRLPLPRPTACRSARTRIATA